MLLNRYTLLAAAGVLALSGSPGYAYEGGGNGQQKAGAFIGASAGVPPPGIYMINQVFTVQANLAGPGIGPALGGKTNTGLQAAVDVQAFLFVPGWTFLGGTYDAVVALPWEMASVGAPLNVQFAGGHNTYIANELAWQLGGGFAIKTGLGIFAPLGTQTGFNGLGNAGSPFWTFQPEVIVSYLNDGWNLSVAVYEEFNTRNTVTGYQSGDILHADFTATKTIGKFTFGPVAYYYGQITSDQCGAKCTNFYGANEALANASSFNIWAVGGLLAYDFGPAAVQLWATQEVSARARNAASIAATGEDLSLIPQGLTVFGTVSFRIWAPEEPAPAGPPMIHK